MKLQDFYSKENKEFNDRTSLYVCGPTVYSEPHIGNMRPIIVFDILAKVLSLKGEVKFVHNITDVDDKIINKAIEMNISEKDVSEMYYESYLKLLKQLNINSVTDMPKVTENINGIISFIEKLINKGNAYESNGSVYFDVSSYQSYGNVLGSQLDDLIEIEENSDKRNPKDFALWKKTIEGVKWKSPWSEGRPGWHTECSFFINEFFGKDGLDIHGGGIDLRFPHHVNEMAQYECACSKLQTANAWAYVGHINMGDEKMSKSLGNVVIAKDFIEEHGTNVLKMIMFQTKNIKPISLNDDAIESSKKTIAKIFNAIKKALLNLAINTDLKIEAAEPSLEFISILENNLDIVNSITYILEQVKIINSNIIDNKIVLEELIANLELLGLTFKINYNEINEKISISKANEDYETLDKLREELVIW